MRIVMFYHSLISDWNHGNAHFLRGVATELQSRGHEVVVYEPHDGWSLTNLCRHHGEETVDQFHAAFEHLRSRFYDPQTINLDSALAGADLVIVHEWNDAHFVARVGRHRAQRAHYRLLFHDTHHRSVTAPSGMARYDLSEYDGVLAFGNVIRDIYLDRGWARRAWTWHEAADSRICQPNGVNGRSKLGDVLWVGNWGDDERGEELREFLVEPTKSIGLATKVYGVRYPDHARDALARANIAYGDWLANFNVPRAFSRYHMTIHVPRRPYTEQLPGIPTIRVFEALACGTPLICAPWEDAEDLFTPGEDYLVAHDGEEMAEHLQRLLNDPEFAAALGRRGRETILSRHTCGHRVDELLNICRELAIETGPGAGGR